MRAVTLLYHDVVEPGRSADSGFCSADADIYKLAPADFERHLDAIAASGHPPHSTITEFLKQPANGSTVPVFLSFDDGGASAVLIADMLDRRGWKGHFFITTDFIGSPGFVTKRAIQELHARGHVIGSHSCSHPKRISHLADAELKHEWAQSVEILQHVLGEKVETASVPGGFYSVRVAEFALRAGIQTLFTSEPVMRFEQIGNCTICGRFGLQQDSPPELARRFAARDRQTLLRHAAFWNAKKLMKRAGGEQWLAFRKWWLAR